MHLSLVDLSRPKYPISKEIVGQDGQFREILILLSPTNNFGDCRKVQGDRPDSHLALFFFNKIMKRLGIILVLYVELLFERRVKGNSVRIEKTRVGNGRKTRRGNRRKFPAGQ